MKCVDVECIWNTMKSLGIILLNIFLFLLSSSTPTFFCVSATHTIEHNRATNPHREFETDRHVPFLKKNVTEQILSMIGHFNSAMHGIVSMWPVNRYTYTEFLLTYF